MSCPHGSLQAGSRACTCNLHAEMVCVWRPLACLCPGCPIWRVSSCVARASHVVKTILPRPQRCWSRELLTVNNSSRTFPSAGAGWRGADFRATACVRKRWMMKWMCRCTSLHYVSECETCIVLVSTLPLSVANKPKVQASSTLVHQQAASRAVRLQPSVSNCAQSLMRCYKRGELLL